MTDPKTGNRFERMGAGRRLALIGGMCLAVLAILFALAEGAVRLRSWFKYGEAAVRIEDAYRFDERLGLRLPKPGFTSARLNIDSHGFRSPEIAQEKPPGTYRLAFLGGSTTFCAEVSGDDRTWPHLVVERLKTARPGQRFDYLNAGVPAFTTQESRTRFEAEVKDFHPDLAVIYHAVNDLTRYSQQIAESKGVDVERGDRDLLWLSKYSMFVYLVEKNLSIMALQREVDDPANKLDVDAADITAPFERHLRDLVRSAKASGAAVALVAFSTRQRPEQSPEGRRAAAASILFHMSFMTADSILEGFTAYNRIIRKVAAEEGAIFVDAAMVVPADTAHFADAIHFTDRGAAVMADYVGRELTAAIPK